MSKKNLGSSIDDFLREENIFEEAQAQAVKEVVAWQLAKAMKKKKNFQGAHGRVAEDEPVAVDRILDPKRDITLTACSGRRLWWGGGWRLSWFDAPPQFTPAQEPLF